MSAVNRRNVEVSVRIPLEGISPSEYEALRSAFDTYSVSIHKAPSVPEVFSYCNISCSYDPDTHIPNGHALVAGRLRTGATVENALDMIDEVMNRATQPIAA